MVERKHFGSIEAHACMYVSPHFNFWASYPLLWKLKWILYQWETSQHHILFFYC